MAEEEENKNKGDQDAKSDDDKQEKKAEDDSKDEKKEQRNPSLADLAKAPVIPPDKKFTESKEEICNPWSIGFFVVGLIAIVAGLAMLIFGWVPSGFLFLIVGAVVIVIDVFGRVH